MKGGGCGRDEDSLSGTIAIFDAMDDAMMWIRGKFEETQFSFDYYVARPNFIIVNSSIVRTSITVLPLPH